MKRSQGVDASAIYTTNSKPCNGKCPDPDKADDTVDRLNPQPA